MSKKNIQIPKHLPDEIKLEIASHLLLGHKLSLDQTLAAKHIANLLKEKNYEEIIEKLIEDNDLAGLKYFHKNIKSLSDNDIYMSAIEFSIIYNKYNIIKWLFATLHLVCNQYMLNRAYELNNVGIMNFLMKNNELHFCDLIVAEAFSKSNDRKSHNRFMRLNRRLNRRTLI